MTLAQLYASVRSGDPATGFTVGDRLRIIRDLKGIRTLRKAALSIGISSSCLSAYETDVKLPSTVMLMKIALFYDVSTDWLLGLSEEMERR